LPAILADPAQIRQVFDNIILNAIQAMPGGGELVIKSRLANADSVAISFSDTGDGMTKETQKNLFESLFTTKEKGTGLGLAVSKALIDLHRGAIEVRSWPGKGSRFTIKLSMCKKK